VKNKSNKKGVEHAFNNNWITFSVVLHELQNVVIILPAAFGKENVVFRAKTNDVDIAVNPKRMKEQLIEETFKNDYS